MKFVVDGADGVNALEIGGDVDGAVVVLLTGAVMLTAVLVVLVAAVVVAVTVVVVAVVVVVVARARMQHQPTPAPFESQYESNDVPLGVPHSDTALKPLPVTLVATGSSIRCTPVPGPYSEMVPIE